MVTKWCFTKLWPTWVGEIGFCVQFFLMVFLLIAVQLFKYTHLFIKCISTPRQYRKYLFFHVDVANPTWWCRVWTSNMQPLCPQTEVHFYKRMNENEWEHAKTGNEWGPQEFRFFGVSKKGLPAATVTIKSEELVANSITPTKSLTTQHIHTYYVGLNLFLKRNAITIPNK